MRCFFLLLFGLVACAHRPLPPMAAASARPTLAIVNARVWTGAGEQPWAEAVLIAGENIDRVGTSAEVRAALADAAVPVIDAGGKLIVPGFIDSHVHLIEGGFRLSQPQLRDATSRESFVARIQAYASSVPEGTWIRGGDWDHSRWGGELPTRQWIDAVTPKHPVWLNRLDGHMALANTAALQVAGITRSTADVPGGEIVRDAQGEPTGVLKDNAMHLVEGIAPPPSDALSDRALVAAMRFVNAAGVTSVHHMGRHFSDLDTFARAHDSGALTLRIYAMVPLAEWEQLREVVQAQRFGGSDGRGDSWLRIGGLKGYMDGSLGSHTAAFYEPFLDAPADTGLLVNKPDDMYKWISAADKAGLQVMVHAIGDRANGLLLDIYERVERENGARDRRFRIEHAQHLRAADVPRFGQLGVIASMQPYHAIDDGRWAEKFIGARIAGMYVFRTLLDDHAQLSFGSDWFVAPPTPLEGIYAATTRRTLDGKNPDGWVPEQKISVEEALRAYTHGPAYASFEDTRKGSLEAGKLADLVVLDQNIFSIAPENIRDVKVLGTLVGGQWVYGDFAGPRR